MEENTEMSSEKKMVNKAKSHITGPPTKLQAEPAKRKSFNANDAVRTLDAALGRLKKSKLVDGEYCSKTAHTSPVRNSFTSSHMFIESSTEPNGLPCSSTMSMNFSHYELMRNLSCSNCCDGADSADGFSSTTSNAYLSASDLTLKNEHLERYFRSAEMWGENRYTEHSIARNSTSETHFKIPDSWTNNKCSAQYQIKRYNERL